MKISKTPASSRRHRDRGPAISGLLGTAPFERILLFKPIFWKASRHSGFSGLCVKQSFLASGSTRLKNDTLGCERNDIICSSSCQYLV